MLRENSDSRGSRSADISSVAIQSATLLVRKRRTKSGIVAVAALWVLASIQPALATDDGKVPTKRGDQYHIANAKTRNMHAYDHARLLGKYAGASDEPVPSDVVKHQLAGIRDNTEMARELFGQLSDDAKQNPAVRKQLLRIQGQLDKVTRLIAELEEQSTTDTLVTKAVTTKVQAIAQELKATHAASKQIDRALNTAIEGNDQFYDEHANDYYFTGEGHFID